jgi:hypothetical protein
MTPRFPHRRMRVGGFSGLMQAGLRVAALSRRHDRVKSKCLLTWMSIKMLAPRWASLGGWFIRSHVGYHSPSIPPPCCANVSRIVGHEVPTTPNYNREGRARVEVIGYLPQASVFPLLGPCFHLKAIAFILCRALCS